MPNGLRFCHRCKHNAGVSNSHTKCFAMKKNVMMNKEIRKCGFFDGSELPGKVLSLVEFNKIINNKE